MRSRNKFEFAIPWLKSSGALVFILLFMIWLWGGAHPGWTLSEVTVWKVDELTGLDFPETQKRFVPGVEFPVVGLACFFCNFMLARGLARFLNK